MQDIKMAQMTEEYVSASKRPALKAKAAMMKENSPRQVIARPRIKESRVHGLNGKGVGPT